jgi:hypothetical protein
MYHDYYNAIHIMTFFEQKDLTPSVDMLAFFTISVMKKTTILTSHNDFKYVMHLYPTHMG